MIERDGMWHCQNSTSGVNVLACECAAGTCLKPNLCEFSCANVHPEICQSWKTTILQNIVNLSKGVNTLLRAEDVSSHSNSTARRMVF